MRVGVPSFIVVLLSAVLAGCVGPDGDDPPVVTPVEPGPPSHVLAGAMEPLEFAAPTFELLGAIAAGGPVYGAGEPSVWADLFGAIWVSFPGCDAGFYLFTVPGQDSCDHGLVYVSRDDGATWTRLNRAGDGLLTEDGPAANGDADIALDAAGTVYASNLGGGIQVLRSEDNGTTWSHAGNVVPEGHWADRQWMAAGAPGHLIMTWMGGDDDCARCVAVNTTFDGGRNWTGVQYLGENIGWLGTVQMDIDDNLAYIPFTENRGGEFALLLAKTSDGGVTWEILDTGARTVPTASPLLYQWSGVLMAPAFDVTGDGHLVWVWSEEVPSPVGQVSTSGVVKLTASADGGHNWSAPIVVSREAAAIMPWVTGGAGDRVAITYFASSVPLDTDYAGRWDVMAVYVDGVGNDAPEMLRTVVETDVHLGGLCSRGGACLISGSDRALLDFFESDLMPDGRLVLTYPADPLTGGKYIEIRVAIQNGGTPLLVPAAAAAMADS